MKNISKKIFFFGTPNIAVPTLEKLCRTENIEISGVGVFPDKPIGRTKTCMPCAVKEFAKNAHLPIFEILNKSDLEKIFETKIFDLAVVIAFGMIFPEKIIEIPKFGVINVHFSLLPEYRGASPVQSALLAGKTVSGITIQKMEKTLDSGDILWQKSYKIENLNTIEVFDFFAQKSAEIFPQFLENYFSKKIVPRTQDHSQATFCQKFEKEAGKIFPETETAESVYRKFLAFTPWPGIFLETKKGNVKLTKIIVGDSTKHHLCCAKNTFLEILEAQIPGKKPLPIQEILKGNPDLFNR